MLLITEHNGDVSPEKHKQCSNCTVRVCHGPGSTQLSSMHLVTIRFCINRIWRRHWKWFTLAHKHRSHL